MSLTPDRVKQLRSILAEDRELFETLFRLDTLPVELQLEILQPLYREFVVPELLKCRDTPWRIVPSYYSLSAAISPNANYLAVGNQIQYNLTENMLELFDISSNTPTKIDSVRIPGRISNESFSPDGKYLAAATTAFAPSTGEVLIWKLLPEGLALFRKWTFPRGIGASHVTYSPDGRYIAVIGVLDGIHILDIQSNSLRYHFPGKRYISLSYRPDGKRIAAGTYDGNVDIWDTENPTTTPFQNFKVPVSHIRSLSYNANNHLALSLDSTETIRVINTESSEIKDITIPGKKPWIVKFINNDTLVVSYYGDSMGILHKSEKRYFIGPSIMTGGSLDAVSSSHCLGAIASSHFNRHGGEVRVINFPLPIDEYLAPPFLLLLYTFSMIKASSPDGYLTPNDYERKLISELPICLQSLVKICYFGELY